MQVYILKLIWKLVTESRILVTSTRQVVSFCDYRLAKEKAGNIVSRTWMLNKTEKNTGLLQSFAKSSTLYKAQRKMFFLTILLS